MLQTGVEAPVWAMGRPRVVLEPGTNVLHSFVPPEGAPAGWAPQPGAVAGSVFWPLAVLVALEILARIDWPSGRRWLAVRWLGLTQVGVVAAVVSYRHLSGLLAWYGEDSVTSTLGPLAVDGLMLLASGALLTTRHAVEASAVVEAEPVAAQAVEPVSEPVPAAAAETAPDPSEAPTATPAVTAAAVRRATPRRKPAAPAPASDEDLLARVSSLVEAGDLAADSVTTSRLRAVLGVGAGRAGRLADAWQEQHRRGTVRQLHAAVAGD